MSTSNGTFGILAGSRWVSDTMSRILAGSRRISTATSGVLARQRSTKSSASEQYRQLVRSYWYDRLVQECDREKMDNRFPFQGDWYTEAEIAKRQEELRVRDRRLLFDLIVLFALAGVLLVAFLVILVGTV